MAAGQVVSKAELDFAVSALRSEGVRVDGRALTACRRASVRFGTSHGEVEVALGTTRALAVCTGEIVVPPPERPNEGRLTFHVEFGPLASPSFDSFGRPSVQATAVGNFVERLIKGSRAIDPEALCIVGGQKVWSIRVDVRALDDEGNLMDACTIAALCSLLHFRKADVEVAGGTAQSFTSEERVPVPLSIHHLPVPVSFALFAPRQGDGDPTCILDPSRLEEAAADGCLTVACNQHGEVCGVHKPGGLPVDFDTVQRCIEVAGRRAKEITLLVRRDVEEDLKRRAASRKNVHKRFASSDLLTVDGLEAANGQKRAGQPPAVAARSVSSALDEAELAAVAAETAALEAQLADIEAEVLGDAASPANGSTASAQAKRGRKKRRGSGQLG